MAGFLFVGAVLAPAALDAQGFGERGPQRQRAPRAIEVTGGIDAVRKTLLGTGFTAELAYLGELTPRSSSRIGLTFREGNDAQPCLDFGRPLPCAEGGGVLEVVGIFVEPRRTVFGTEPEDRLRIEAGTRVSIERLRNGWDQDGFGLAGVAGLRYEVADGVSATLTGQGGYLWFPNAILSSGIRYSGFRASLRAGVVVRLP